jgi:hypothetical protein
MLTRYQKSILRTHRILGKNIGTGLSFERAALIFGVDIQKLLVVSEFQEYPNWDSVKDFIEANATPSNVKLKPKYSASVRKELSEYANELKEVPGYDSEYFRDGRIWGPAAISKISAILGRDYKSVKDEYYSQPGYTYRETHYDDTCGFGGGHHVPDGWTDKAFCIVSYINYLINEEVSYDTRNGNIVEEVPVEVSIKIKEWDVTLSGDVESLATVAGYVISHFNSMIVFPESRPLASEKLARILKTNNVLVDVA